MLVAIGKGIELEVDVTRFNSEVHDHIVRTDIRKSADGRSCTLSQGDAGPREYRRRGRTVNATRLPTVSTPTTVAANARQDAWNPTA